MNSEQLMAWAAGLLDGCGTLYITIEQGPTREYHAITLQVAPSDAKGVERMIIASGNGGPSRTFPELNVWELRGIEAIRGFLAEVWPLLLPETRSRFNHEIKRYRALKQIAS